MYQSRASSLYKGTFDGLCISAARSERARRCGAAAAIEVSFDFVKGSGGFGPQEQPDKVNLFTQCGPAKCAIGLTVKGGAKLSVREQNEAKCKLVGFPGPKDPPGTAAFTLRVTCGMLAVKSRNDEGENCELLSSLEICLTSVKDDSSAPRAESGFRFRWPDAKSSGSNPLHSLSRR